MMAQQVTAADVIAQRAALRRLQDAHDKFAGKEMRAVDRGDYEEADHHHKYVLWIARAFGAERDDPTPAGLA